MVHEQGNNPSDIVTINMAAMTVGVTWQRIDNWISQKYLTAYTRPGERTPRVSLSQVKEVARWRTMQPTQED